MDSPGQTGSLYPDLGDIVVDTDESDPLADLEAWASQPAKKKPPRPPGPPPRTISEPGRPQHGNSQPRSDSAISLPDPPYQDVVIPPPLSVDELRWFYREPGKFWQPFNGYDSLRLEDCYMRLQEGFVGGGQCEVVVLGDLYEANILEKLLRPIYWTGKDPWKVLRGCWFEVSGDKWYPLEESDYTRIEEEHRSRKWRQRARADADLQAWAMGNKQQDNEKPQSSTLVIVNKLSLEKYEVLWLNDKEIFKMKKEISSQLWSKLGKTLGRGELYGSAKLVRGYKDRASPEDREPPIGHLVFVIHGIGQSLDISDIAKSTSDLREACSQVAKKQFAESWQKGRVEFLPVEWRTWLSLDKGVLGMITPHGVRMIRGVFNDTVVDVMYYMSSRFGPEILDGLRFSLHKQYNEFMKRNPRFISTGGTISIIAHSLGSVMMFDLFHLTCSAAGIDHKDPAESSQQGPQKAVEVKGDTQGVKFTAGLQSPEASLGFDETMPFDEPDSGGEDLSAARIELEQLRQRVTELESKLGISKKHQGLMFTVDHFFAVGSPLALFLVMREHEALIKRGHKGAASLIPSCVCKRIHNLHHPSDPIAYRLEPLINPAYAQIKPVRVDTGSRLSKEAVDHAEGPKAAEKTPPQSRSSWFSSLLGTSSKKPSSVEPSKPKNPEKVLENDKSLRPEDKLKERIDFMFRESFTEVSYLNSLTAHTCYWSSPDCAKYLLLQLYKYKKTQE